MAVLACVHHLEQPFLGHAAPALGATDLEILVTDTRRGDPLPPVDAIDGILSFGGEQSVVDIDDHPALAAEAAWLREAVDGGIPVLGVCLGAQLLAHALGSRVRRLPRRMLSWEPLDPTAEADGDPLMAALPAGARGLHWNEDGFEPPPGAVELVRRTAPSCQAFRFGSCAWGVQFHPDIDPATLDRWYETWSALPAEAGVPVELARAADAQHLPAHRQAGEALFGAFVDVVRRRR